MLKNTFSNIVENIGEMTNGPNRMKSDWNQITNLSEINSDRKESFGTGIASRNLCRPQLETSGAEHTTPTRGKIDTV